MSRSSAAVGDSSALTDSEGVPASTVRSRFLILHNPSAGRNGTALPREVAAELRSRGAAVDEQLLNVGLPLRLAQAAPYDSVVVSGGDGTVRSIATAIAQMDIPLGLIPNGTGNVLAEELALPRTAGEIAECLLHAPTTTLAAGEANGELFLLMCGIGFDGEVVGGLREHRKRWLGKMAYASPILHALWRKPTRFAIELDGRSLDASWVVIANASHYGGRFLLTRATCALQPGLIAIVSQAHCRRQRLYELLLLAMGRIERAATITALSIEVARIAGAPSAQIDGDPLPVGDVEICARARGIRVIAPARACDR